MARNQSIQMKRPTHLNLLPLVVDVLEPRQEESTVVPGADVSVLLLLLHVNRSVDLRVTDVGTKTERKGLVSQRPRRTPVNSQDLLFYRQDQLLLLNEVPLAEVEALVLLPDRKRTQMKRINRGCQSYDACTEA